MEKGHDCTLYSEKTGRTCPHILGYFRRLFYEPSFLHMFMLAAAAAAAKSLQSCGTLCDPMDGSPAGSPVPGILQARTLSGLPFPSAMHESEK